MKIKLLILLLLSIFFIFLEVKAQTIEVDSLEVLLKNHTTEDTVRVNMLLELAKKNYFVTNDFEETFKYANEAIELADKIGFKKGKVKCYNLIGVLYYYQANYSGAEKYYGRL